MNPVVLASFGTKIGPWLGRAAAAAPTLMPRLVSALKVGGQFAGKSVTDIVTWAKLKPGNAVLLASTLASLGFDVSSLFGDSKDPEVQLFQKGLSQVVSAAGATIDAIGAQSVNAAFTSNDEKAELAVEVEIEVLSWARGFFGSPHAAVEAHRMLQAFVEMPLARVRNGFSIYRLR